MVHQLYLGLATMRKEVGYAVIAGIMLGLVVAFGIYRINSQVSRNKNISAKSTPTPAPKSPTQFKIILDKPGQNDVATAGSVNISGLTKPNTWVIVSGEAEDYITRSDGSGAFGGSLNLTSGVNQIKATAFDTSGNQTSAGVLVVYSQSFVEKSLDTKSSSDSSGSSNISQKVAKDLLNTLDRPKTYLGTVTDVTDSTIELKTKPGEIMQISVNPATVVVNALGTNNKTVKTTDIAIGDFIVGMGYVGNNSVLSAQRILISDPVTEPTTTVSLAKVTNTTKKSLEASTIPDSKDDTITPDKNTDIETFKDGKAIAAKFAGIADDDIVMYVRAQNSKKDTIIRYIFVIPQS